MAPTLRLLASATLTLLLVTGCVADRADEADATAADVSGGQDTGGANQLDGGLPPEITVSTVAELQAEAEAKGCSDSAIETVNDAVAVSGVVVTAPKYEAYTYDDGSGGLDGYFVADAAGGDWSGMMIVIDRAEGMDFQPGDVLDLTGQLVEYYCMTQISVSGYAVTGSVEAPAPLLVDPFEASVEMYEGMLLRVEDVEVTSTDGYGNATVSGGLVVGDIYDLYAGMEENGVYNVTGVLMTDFKEYRLMPRTLDDVVDLQNPPIEPSDTVQPSDATGDTTPPEDGGPTDTTQGGEVMTISELQQSEASLACENGIVNGPEGLVVEGTIAVSAFEVHETLNAYMISDGSGEAWSGVTVVVPKADDEGWLPGQILRVTGDHVEFYCATQLSATSVEVIGQSETPSVAVAINASVSDMEPWEGTVVSLQNVQVTGIDAFESFGEIQVSLDGGATSAPFLLDDWVMGKGAIEAPAVGHVWSSVLGVVTYGYGSYRVAPLNAESMVSDQ